MVNRFHPREVRSSSLPVSDHFNTLVPKMDLNLSFGRAFENLPLPHPKPRTYHPQHPGLTLSLTHKAEFRKVRLLESRFSSASPHCLRFLHRDGPLLKKGPPAAGQLAVHHAGDRVPGMRGGLFAYPFRRMQPDRSCICVLRKEARDGVCSLYRENP